MINATRAWTYARVGWLGATLALAIALVAGAWMNQRAAASAADLLNRGQAEVLESAARAAFHPWGPEVDSAALAMFLEDQSAAGLRYIALLEPNGSLREEIGVTDTPPDPPVRGGPAEELPIIDMGDRIRAYFFRPSGFGQGQDPRRFQGGPPGNPNFTQPPRGGLDPRRDSIRRADSARGVPPPFSQPGLGQQFGQQPGGQSLLGQQPGGQSQGAQQQGGARPQDGGRQGGVQPPTGAGQQDDRGDGRRGNGGGFRPGRGGGPPRGGDAYLILEFEPVVAASVVAGATRSLGLSWLAASILTLVALLFWKLSEKYSEAQLSLIEQRRLSQLGEMSAVMAHEIRNPLASLKGHAQLLAENLTAGSKDRSRADRVISEATRLESLTSDLLDFARSGALDLKSVDPVAPVRASISDLGEDSFELDTSDAPEKWSLDVNRLRQLLLNVLQNAKQASPNGRKPRVRVSSEGRSLVYEIQDYGPGLPAGSESRIFDPFFTTRTNGNGLGLAVARRVAEMHGGTITAWNHAEGGALFRVVIPDAERRGTWRPS